MTLEKDDEEKVARLSDMETKEVSIVDRAANKKTFILVKRDAETKAEKSAPAATAEPTAPAVVAKYDIDRALARVGAADLIGAALSTASTSTAKFVIVKSSLDEPSRARALDAIGKALRDLGEVYVCLQTEVDKVVHPADAFEVRSRLAGVSGLVASAFDETEKNSKEDPVEDVAKLGRPMQGDRLTRLKGAVTVLKEALADLRGGSVSLEKFKKAASMLGGIISELDVAKRVTERDERGVDPYAPNLGSGVQPDLAVVGTIKDVFGEGVPPALAAVMKREIDGALVEVKAQNAELAKGIKQRDVKLQALGAELASLKKTRVAPSTAPADGGGSSPSTDELVAWPRDMAEETTSAWARR